MSALLFSGDVDVDFVSERACALRNERYLTFSLLIPRLNLLDTIHMNVEAKISETLECNDLSTTNSYVAICVGYYSFLAFAPTHHSA